MIAQLENTTWRSFLVLGIAAALLTWNPPKYELPADTSWHLLMEVDDVSVLEVLPDTLRNLEGQAMVLKGFMFPLEHGRDQQRFLLSPYPADCAYHEHGNPAAMVEVFAQEAVRYTFEAVTIHGVFTLLPGEEGVRYQLHEATLENMP